MCPNCFSAGFSGFPSYWEFEAFETKLRQKLMGQQLRQLPNTRLPEFVAMAPEQLYQCLACGETWALSSPDNAWRGYFLPLTEALAHGRQLARRGRARSMGCLVLLLAFACFTVWRLLSS